MRQLLGRKSRSKLGPVEENDNPRVPSSTPGVTSERVFPVRAGNTRSTADVLPPITKTGSLTFDELRLEENHTTYPTKQPAFPTHQPAFPAHQSAIPTHQSAVPTHENLMLHSRTNGGPPARVGSLSSTNGEDPRRTTDMETRVVPNQEPRRMADTSQYVFTESGPPQIQLTLRCEDEPIHTPGAIQTFGALLGLRYSQDGRLQVRIASENTRKIIGFGPEQLFGLPSFLDVLKPEAQQDLVSRIDHLLSDPEAVNQETRLDVFQIVLSFPYEPDTRLWCAMHLTKSPTNMVIMEFEEYTDSFYTKDAEHSKILPVNLVHTLGFDKDPPEELEKSTTMKSQPLQVLRLARQRTHKEFSPMDLFSAITQAQKQIVACTSVEMIFDVVVGIISELTGFHRVMFYRFDSQMNGCVEAEMLNAQASTDIYRGLNYPAADIPKQARDLYKINRIRILHDRDAITAKLVCREESDMESPIDLTHAYLRAMSPIHNKYLANMGVRSTMSISIVIDNKLWGLVACHGYGDLGTRVSLPVRELCRNIGECAAVNIQRLTMQQRISARKVPAPSPTTLNPSGFVANTSSDLLKLVDSDFALFSIDGEARAVGRLDPYQEAIAIMSYLQECKFTTIRSSHNITSDFPGLSYPPGLKGIAGLLYIPLNSAERTNFLVFFRKGQEKHVKWAGDPNQKKTRSGTNGYLEPRMSFQRWSEKITGTSKEWTEDQYDTASVLGLLYGRSIDAWRSKSSGSPSSSGFEEPAVASIETFNLSVTATRVMKSLQKEAERKGLELSVTVQEQLPAMVKGDGHLFKQLLVYFTSSAFLECSSVKVDINLLRTKDEMSIIGLTVVDSGPGKSEDQLDDVFQEFEQAQEDGWPLSKDDRSSTDSNGGSNPDLPAIARYVRNMNGQISVTSELGRGTVFSVELPFEPIDTSKPRKLRNLFSSSSSSSATQKAAVPTVAPPKSKQPENPRVIESHMQAYSPFPQPSQQAPKAKDLERIAQTHVDTEAFPSPPQRQTPSYSTVPPAHPTEKASNFRPGPYDHPLNRHNIRVDTPPLSPKNKDVQLAQAQLTVLIAEDEPSKLKLLEEKISAMGHKVDVCSDGQECHSRYASNPTKFDIILMDLEMPIVDGGLSTRMIRFLEKESKRDAKSRVPIIALSASFDEDSRMDYMANGFDGLVLKPVDFRSLETILQGVKKPKAKREALYFPGEKGGWFMP